MKIRAFYNIGMGRDNYFIVGRFFLARLLQMFQIGMFFIFAIAHFGELFRACLTCQEHCLGYMREISVSVSYGQTRLAGHMSCGDLSIRNFITQRCTLHCFPLWFPRRIKKVLSIYVKQFWLTFSSTLAREKSTTTPIIDAIEGRILVFCLRILR